MELLKKLFKKTEIEYSQEELKEFFYREMTKEEKQKIKELGLKQEIKKLTTKVLFDDTYQIKYLTDVGYVFISEVCERRKDGTKEPHYFVEIVESKKEAIKCIKEDFKEEFWKDEY